MLPSLDRGPVVVIPPSQLRNVYGKPESQIDACGAQNELVQSAYTVTDKEVYLNDFQVDVVRKQLTKNLPVLSECIAEELAVAFQQHWGNSTEWHTVPAWGSMIKVISQTANRVIVGAPLCKQTRSNMPHHHLTHVKGRNEDFLDYSRKYSMSVFGGATVINIFPPFLRPLVGRAVGLMTARYRAMCRKLCLPVVESRLRMNREKRRDASFAWEPPVGPVDHAEQLSIGLLADCYK